MVADESIVQLRNMFLEKYKLNGSTIPGGVHNADMDRIQNEDFWLRSFLEHNESDMKASLNHLWESVEWRKKNNVNEISVENIRMDYINDGLFFPHNRDTNNKPMLIFLSKHYVKGVKDGDEVKKCLVYYIERLQREYNYEQITVFFDMTDAGLSNMDMDFTKYIINIFKFYYPDALNNILVYNMPWILNATFKIIKSLLPAKAAAKMKFINQKSIREFVNEDNMLKIWGGKDDYKFSFVPESSTPSMNSSKKVHFANMSSLNESPISESTPSFQEKGDGEMLRIVPQDILPFTKIGNEFLGSMEIFNICDKSIIYKIKTTAPEKFRVKPYTGILSPGSSSKISIALSQGHHISSRDHDKFLVMCMETKENPESMSDLAELWKNTCAGSVVEQHRLNSALHSSVTDGQKNGNIYSGGINSDRQMSHVSSSISQLTETTQRLESQIKFNQTLQWIILVVFLLLSIAVVYILKIEIRNNCSQHCLLQDE